MIYCILTWAWQIIYLSCSWSRFQANISQRLPNFLAHSIVLTWARYYILARYSSLALVNSISWVFIFHCIYFWIILAWTWWGKSIFLARFIDAQRISLWFRTERWNIFIYWTSKWATACYIILTRTWNLIGFIFFSFSTNSRINNEIRFWMFV